MGVNGTWRVDSCRLDAQEGLGRTSYPHWASKSVQHKDKRGLLEK
jgi:hypothetical protein